MAVCEACGYDYDARKRKCPQCSAPYKPTKADLDKAGSEEAFDIEGKPATEQLTEPLSPTMDRQEVLLKQLKLAEEKRGILLQQQEVKALEIRLQGINKENADIERNLAGKPLVTSGSADAHQEPATALQDGGPHTSTTLTQSQIAANIAAKQQLLRQREREERDRAVAAPQGPCSMRMARL